MNANEMDQFQFPSEAEGFNELIREFSPSGQLVAVIGVRPDKTYTYTIYFWDTTDYEYSGAGWAPGGRGGIFSDLDTAVSEAKIELLARSRHGKI